MLYVARDNRGGRARSLDMTAKFTGPSVPLSAPLEVFREGGSVVGDGFCEAEMDRKWRREVQMQNEYRRGQNLDIVKGSCNERDRAHLRPLSPLSPWRRAPGEGVGCLLVSPVMPPRPKGALTLGK